MFKKIVVLAISAVALSACTPEYPEWQPDQTKRAELFDKCMKSLPAGPVSTHYNDWDEVVDSCANTAYRLSLYCVAHCPPKPDEVGREEKSK